MRPQSSSVSVLITTKNRARFLKACLNSLVNQTRSPKEVVVVDNGSSDETQQVCHMFAKKLLLRYFFEKRVGIPFGRNTGIKHATGAICAFIDDDCIVDSNWLSCIYNHFISHNNSVGAIGLTANLFPNNVASAVEYAYYRRWLKQWRLDGNTVQKIPSGRLIDFKNAAFRSNFIKKFHFSIKAPFGDVGDEDIEIGNRFYKANRNIYFDPSIVVTHRYSDRIYRLFVRNFWNGYANEKLYSDFSIKTQNMNTTRVKTDLKGNFLKRLTYIAFIKAYPAVSYLGKTYASLGKYLRIQTSIPQR